MNYVRREDITKTIAPGRIIQRAFGTDAYFTVDNANMGFAHFSPEYGKMPCHVHEDEIIYVMNANDAYVKYGPSENDLSNKKELNAGDILRFSEKEWHIFEFTCVQGYLDIIFIFSQGKINVINGK